MRLDLSAQSFGISPDVAKNCEGKVIEIINRSSMDKIESYRNIVREKLEGINKISPKARIYLNLKIEELGLSKNMAEKCEQEQLTIIDKETEIDAPEDIKHCLKKAEQGNADAQFEMGLNYLLGLDVAEDKQEAIKWYRKAAEQGNADAQNALGDMFYLGDGISQDYKEAANWYAKAAEQGDSYAQLSLGQMYSGGVYFAQNDNKAFKLYIKAADAENFQACIVIAAWYLTGRKVPQNFQKAKEYLLKGLKNIGSQDKENMCRELLEWCVDYFSDGSSFYPFLTAPISKTSNALDTFLSPFEEDEEIIMFYDDTFFGSAKNGFAISTRLIAWKNDFEDTHKSPLSWKGLEKISLTPTGLCFNEQGSNITITGASQEKMITLARLLEFLHVISTHSANVGL